MAPTSLGQRLGEHQDSILGILRDAETMLNDEATRDIPGLARARWALMREFTAYQLLKHSKLLDPAIAKGAPAEARRLERLKQGGVEVVDAFRGNVTRWSAVDVAGVWPAYRASALAMIARIREQVTRERGELTALTTGTAIPPPAAAPPRRDPPTPAG